VQTLETKYDGAPGDADVRAETVKPPCFRILGLLQVHGSEQYLVTARRQQVVLALLLLNGNRVVPLESLLDALWGATPPATARAQVQTCVSALRRSLANAGLGERIRVRGLGYSIDLRPNELDLDVFEALVVRGQAALAAKNPLAARAAFREALGLWRGEPLTGIDSCILRVNQVRISERRVEVLEDCIDAELELGLHREVVGEISVMVAEHPLRERFVGQLMTALYRCGRRVEALAVYRSMRQTYVDELGLEPSPAVRRLHQDILTGSAETVPSAPAPEIALPSQRMPVPRMLPARVPYFTGHGELLGKLRGQLVENDAALVAVITGRGGVGKSTVAIEAAHQLAAEFPDGQLYARMTDQAGRAENTADVLERFLRALGFAVAEIPADLEGRAALYRSAIAGRRLLTVIEDAADEAQVRPLVPGTPTCRLIMTTRTRTAELPGSTVFELDVLDTAGGLELLSAMAGGERVCTELGEAGELVELCGGLQLALNGAVAQLAARPHWTFAQLVARLRNERHRLDQLGHQGIDIRASLRRGYVGLPPAAKRLFARLGLLETGDCAAWVAASLLDLDAGSAADALETLVDARLVDVVSGTGVTARYRLHELARVYSREQLFSEEPPEERVAALRRVFGAWLCLADDARVRQGGNRVAARGDAPRWPLPEPVLDAVLADPKAWYELERAALLATVRQAARVDAVDHCWNLAIAVANLAGAQHRFVDWRDSNECALRAALRAGNRRGEATIQYSLGELDLLEHRYSEAAARINLSLGVFEQLGEAGWNELIQRSLAIVEQARANAPSQWIDHVPTVRAEPRRITPRPHHFELASSTDTFTHHENTTRGGIRTGSRRLPRPRPISWRKESENPEDR
jgi:DNA-binding SARP family transcriptional activator